VIRPIPSLKARGGAAPAVRMMVDATEGGPARLRGDDLFLDGNNSGALLANFTMDRGEDERGPYISIYDRYDLDQVPLSDRLVGRPWEYYDRIHYNPDTYEPLADNEEDVPSPQRAAAEGRARTRKAAQP
jgi:hypothetical protein